MSSIAAIIELLYILGFMFVCAKGVITLDKVDLRTNVQLFVFSIVVDILHVIDDHLGGFAAARRAGILRLAHLTLFTVYGAYPSFFIGWTPRHLTFTVLDR